MFMAQLLLPIIMATIIVNIAVNSSFMSLIIRKQIIPGHYQITDEIIKGKNAVRIY